MDDHLSGIKWVLELISQSGEYWLSSELCDPPRFGWHSFKEALSLGHVRSPWQPIPLPGAQAGGVSSAGASEAAGDVLRREDCLAREALFRRASHS